MPPRGSQAQKRLDMAKMANRPAVDAASEATIDGVVTALTPHIAAAIEALGKAAADGDVIAAKAILEFVKSATQDKLSTRGQDMLERIAKIRGDKHGPAAQRPLPTID